CVALFSVFIVGLLTELLISSLVFFFFKQKTAYEITRRDWSSDVCSSDPTTCRAQTQRRTCRVSGTSPCRWPTTCARPSPRRSEERRVGKECALLCRSR